jgi:hypothetical protein
MRFSAGEPFRAVRERRRLDVAVRATAGMLTD